MRYGILALGLRLAGILLLSAGSTSAPVGWTSEERVQIASMALSNLGPPPDDPSNRVADDPRAIELGRALFFDRRLSRDGSVSCASCHVPEKQFQDSQPLGQGVGTTGRRTMPIAGAAYMPFLFWDGRKDSLWSQALGPLESAVEHGGDRTQYAHLIAEVYREPYEALFGRLPRLTTLPGHAGPVDDPASSNAWQSMRETDRTAVTRVFSNIGKAIAAYERTITPPGTRFDAYALAVSAGRHDDSLTRDEVAGLKLFLGKADCVKCHNGPLFSDGHFHNTGMTPRGGQEPDRGRVAGVDLVREDPFNCLGPYSDAPQEACVELRFMADGPDLVGAMKTPSLRGVAIRAPYMHSGQIDTLKEVLAHYLTAPAAPVGQTELRPLDLSDREVRQIEAFLSSLTPDAG